MDRTERDNREQRVTSICRIDRHLPVPAWTSVSRPMDISEASEPPAQPAAFWSIDQVIEIACLAGRDAVGSLHLAPSPRPSDSELRRYRRLATDCGFTLAVTGTHVILLPAVAAPPPPPSPRRGARLWLAVTRRVARRPAVSPRSRTRLAYVGAVRVRWRRG